MKHYELKIFDYTDVISIHSGFVNNVITQTPAHINPLIFLTNIRGYCEILNTQYESFRELTEEEFQDIKRDKGIK